MAARYSSRVELPALKRSKRESVSISSSPSYDSRSEVLNFGFGQCFLFLDVLNPCKDVWVPVRLADDFLHPGVSPLEMVKIVPVNRWKASINSSGREVVNKLINSWDVQGTLLDGIHK